MKRIIQLDIAKPINFLLNAREPENYFPKSKN